MKKEQSLIPPIHRRHFILNKVLGQSPEDIAAAEKTTKERIEKSIQTFELYQSIHSTEQVAMGQAAIVLKNLELEQAALSHALQAHRTVIVTREGREQLVESDVPDHETRLHAVEIINSKVEAIMPKGGGINVNTNLGVNVANSPTISMSYEDRLRQIKEKRESLLLEAPAVDVDAEDSVIPLGD